MATPKSYTSPPPDAQVAWIAARQHGQVAHAQLLAAGLSPAGIRRRSDAGWIHRRHVGVYAVGYPSRTPRARWMAAVLAGGEGAVLSHRSAGALWGLCADGTRPEITVARRNRRDMPGVAVHANAIRPGDTVVVDGIRVTKIARTLLDLAEVLTLEQLVQAIDQATAMRHLRPNLMRSMLKQARGRHGLKPLKEALLRTRPQDVLTRSELERRALRLLARTRLPAPEVNVRLHGRERDLLWRAQHIVVELDGRDHHDKEQDTRRDTDLLALGYTTIRFTWRQIVNDADWVVNRLTTVLGR
jgi:very-short-patch-repair endonuclease